MFINVLRKSPQKQFTGELTDLQSFLTQVPAQPPKVQRWQRSLNLTQSPWTGRPPTGCVFSQMGAVMSWTANPERVHIHACGAFISDANPSSFTFHNETVGEWEKKKEKTHVSHETPLWPSKTQLSGICHTAQMHLVQQSNKQKIIEKKPRWNLWTHKDTRSVNLLMLEKCPTPSLRTLNDNLRWR